MNDNDPNSRIRFGWDRTGTELEMEHNSLQRGLMGLRCTTYGALV